MGVRRGTEPASVDSGQWTVGGQWTADSGHQADRMGEDVISSLRGKVLMNPTKQKWMLKKDAGPASEDPDGDYEFNYDPRAPKWTPMNSNLQMQGIRVMEHAPVPEETLQLKGDSTQDTLMLLELLKQQKQNEARGRKEEKIREMAMEQKRKKEQTSQIKLSWL